jgi:hypothetical protein
MASENKISRSPGPLRSFLFTMVALIMIIASIELGARAIYAISHGKGFPSEAMRFKVFDIAGKAASETSKKVSVHRDRHKQSEERWGRLGEGDGLPLHPNRAQSRLKPGELLPKKVGRDPADNDYKWKIAAKQGVEHNEYQEVAHPYLGFVRDPGSGVSVSGTNVISSYGFVDSNDPVVKRSPETLNIAIFGGSFAQQMAMMARDALREGLRPLGKRVVIRNFAMASYKQPQQLMALAYVTALGAQFDVVINLDGFNEVVLPVTDNLPYDIFPVYPRGWAQRVATIASMDELKSLGLLASIDERRTAMAKLMRDYHLYNSVALTICWDALDHSLYRKRLNLSLKIERAMANADKRFIGSGPEFEVPPDQRLYDYLAGVWKRCSMQMAKISESNDSMYIHFLQPNQYLAGTKPMGRDEMAEALDPDHPYRPSVIKGYPALKREGAQLTMKGVRFHDLTNLFFREPAKVYVDTCCHLNAQGYAIVAKVISDRIVHGLQGKI